MPRGTQGTGGTRRWWHKGPACPLPAELQQGAAEEANVTLSVRKESGRACWQLRLCGPTPGAKSQHLQLSSTLSGHVCRLEPGQLVQWRLGHPT